MPLTRRATASARIPIHAASGLFRVAGASYTEPAQRLQTGRPLMI